MIRTEDIRSITDGNVHGADGEKIGSVGQVYLDNHSGQPAWVTVKTGLFGTKASFVPLAEASVDGRDLRVPYDKETIKKAPNVDADGELTPAEEDELYRYYGVDSGEQGQGKDRSDSGQSSRGHDSGEAAAAGVAGGGVAGGVAGHEAAHRGEDHAESRGEHRDKPSSEHREESRGEDRPEHPDARGEHRAEETQGAPDTEREHEGERARGGQEGAGEQEGGGRRIRRYIVTEETITRREEL